MGQLKNKKGMTLVEIVVVLLIASLLLIITGSLILNSFSYFGEASSKDLSRRSLESISDFVRGELLYSSDMRIAASAPQDDEEWQVLYVKDGKLFHNEQSLFSSTFYNHKQLEMQIRGFDSYRIDLDYALHTDDNMEDYTTRDTLELLNIKLKVESDNSFDPFQNISTKVKVSDTNRIYYKKGVKMIQPPQPEDPGEGTVGDQIQCLNAFNNRGKFTPGQFYKIGDMVFYKGYWWINFHANWVLEEAGNPSNNHWWKKIDYRFDEDSIYEKGDIIYHNGNYYKANVDMINLGSCPIPGESWGIRYWEQIRQDDIEASLSCKENPDNDESVSNKLDYSDLDEVEEFKGGEEYEIGDVVKLSDNDGYIAYYMKVLYDSGKNVPGTNPNSGWQRLTRDYDPYSTYLKGDVVFYTDDTSTLVRIRAKQDIIDKSGELGDKQSIVDNEYWEIIK